MSLVGQAAFLVSFPVAASGIGAGIAVLRPPGPRVVSAIQHFAAGVVIAALAGEVLPDLRNEGNLGWAATGFVCGVTLVLSLAAYGRRIDSRDRSSGTSARSLPLGLLAAVAIDLLIDGLLVGLGVRLGSTQALILTVALTLEILFLSLSLVAELSDSGLSAMRATAVCTGLGLVTAVGAVGAAALLAGVGTAVLAFVLAFGAAALLYLAVEELIVEAHDQTETTFLSAMLFAGFLCIYVLGELAA
ncbi:ZIP family metal transporter [Mycobacterium antarcticum]|uniref:ZIP family metal transporter n=1 Tax=unclassified Mycolicibacterium TaxID=2636767 RepID=UPI0023832C63|nr:MULTISPECIES: ZIP family metal transporter [unclassified Mycolicibacterium]BDX32354.1 ZIP family metal transporter [Mycolicibacterium sp. TUM20985]GLP84103.1 ZIP family metal transporter [Mycolicibacterium sp. TUM20984]